ncbi:MAG TPA: ion channel [Nitrospirota bacterium]|nr:ion channel [Nitrospirota bacterium]
MPGSMLSRVIGFWTEERSLTVMLLLLVLHLFILTPVRFLSHVFSVFSVLFLSLALLAGFLTMVRQRALRWIWIAFVAGTILFKSAAFVVEAPWLITGDTIFTFFSLSALVYVVFLQVSRDGPVTAHRIRGAIALYLLIAMLFAFLYSLAEELAPGAFSMPGGWSRAAASSGEAFYYFSIVTMTTVGFGDITAVHPLVRSLVMLEALIGQLYPAILLARLVTLEIETRRAGK